jgi:ketosteroid isomerase-like protein
MMERDVMLRMRAGLEAWQRGEVAALEPLLDPAVELLWWEPGEWDCRGRDAVLECLRERAATGATGGELDLAEAGEDRLVVSRRGVVEDGPAAGLSPATLIALRDGKVVSMQQFQSRDDALAALR